MIQNSLLQITPFSDISLPTKENPFIIVFIPRRKSEYHPPLDLVSSVGILWGCAFSVPGETSARWLLGLSSCFSGVASGSPSGLAVSSTPVPKGGGTFWKSFPNCSGEVVGSTSCGPPGSDLTFTALTSAGPHWITETLLTCCCCCCCSCLVLLNTLLWLRGTPLSVLMWTPSLPPATINTRINKNVHELLARCNKI